MKKVFDILFSTKMTMILLVIFAIGMGAATFIEEFYDTTTARLVVYNAKWFELILLLMAINFIGNIKKYNLLSRGKLAGLIFHIAFVLMIIGAGITRYTGFEGNMHIREGESSDIVYSSEQYLRVFIPGAKNNYAHNIPLKLSLLGNNKFHYSFETEDYGTVDISYKRFLKNAQKRIVEHVEGGKDKIDVSYFMHNQKKNIILDDGEQKEIAGIAFSFNKEGVDGIQFFENGGNLYMSFPGIIRETNMQTMETLSYEGDTLIVFKEKYIYTVQGIMFSYNNFFKRAQSQLVSSDGSTNRSPDALIFDMSLNGKNHELTVFGGYGYIAGFEKKLIDGIECKFAFGNLPFKIPFSLYLTDFQLDRYAGSMSPSSFASEVKVIDNKSNLTKDYRIFMNNVLDYKGYRFFQSSYDQDEKGTILSVNHDFWGTWISYTGYFLMTVGFLFSMLSRKSRFFVVLKTIKQVRSMRKSAIVAVSLLLITGNSVSARDNESFKISENHTRQFGELLVQIHNGRFQPVHTLAYDVLHKTYRKDKYITPEGQKIDGMQVFLSMILNPEYWKEQKMIYIREKSVRDILGINGKYASFNDFFNEQFNYKLADFTDNAYRKERIEQTRFDREIIKVNERLNICMMVYAGSMLKIFPVENSTNNKWISWDDSIAFKQRKADLPLINTDMHLNKLNYHDLMQKYFAELMLASQSNDYSKVSNILHYIKEIQHHIADKDLLPSDAKIRCEVFYNKAKIFNALKNIYMFLSVILLILSFVENLQSRRNKIMHVLLYFFIIILAVAFLYHSFGMGLRWYLSGHAPWSNGYEALLLVAWGGLLAGFCFIRSSKITLAATSLLAFFMLMIAGLSNYDPQLTNLQPVLKSYWLIFHVASITISYGFLGLGFFLGLINVILFLFRTVKNVSRLDLVIKELTLINEVNLSIGLVLASIGTFLGAIWANESWGRYWGWDAKETWALVIIITYAIILHFRLVPFLKGLFTFNVAAVFGFASVLMTFFGVNYYLSKGLHSYAAGDAPVFPVWIWGIVISLFCIVLIAAFNNKSVNIKVDLDMKDIENGIK